MQELRAGFSQPRITNIANIEKLILNWSNYKHTLKDGELSSICKLYELDQQRLITNLNTLKSGVAFRKMAELVTYFKKLQPETRGLYSELLKLIKILLLLPITSCSPEWSFSVMNRVKSYLRSAMGQERLNGLCLRHAYPELCDQVSIEEMVKEFVNNASRLSAFAKL